MRVFLCYPCGNLYQRGEDRCQSNIKASTATTMRACNDLGYMAAVLRDNHDIFLKDYQTEKLSYVDLLKDIVDFKPNFVFISTTNATVFDDIDLVNKLKNDINFTFKVVLKGALFFNAERDLLDKLNLVNIDFLVGNEIEFIVKDIVERNDLEEISGIWYKSGIEWYRTKFKGFCTDLDSLPFPARDLMNNKLYIRPDNGRPMATIQTHRGCPSNCIYCLTPTISGNNVRFRSPENVFEEIKECYYTYNIKDFFFKADTFTINKEWVLKLCDLIKGSDLNGNIHYTVNSRVKPISEEVLVALKETGCFTIAYGFESGSDITLKNIKKGTTVEDNYAAVEMTKRVGIPIFGFFMIGFPWETEDMVYETKKLIFDLDCDFIEVHLVLPYYGSALYNLYERENLLNTISIGTDYFHSSNKGTKYITEKKLVKLRKQILLTYCCRPSYILKKLISCKFNIRVIISYIKFGGRLIKNVFSK